VNSSRMSANAILLMQSRTVDAIVRSGFWSALRDGHFAYYSTQVFCPDGGIVGAQCRLQLGASALWPNDLVGPRQKGSGWEAWQGTLIDR
jgi:hypothetical protein